jgi:hypothetical protein
MADPVLASMVHAMGLENAPHYTAGTPEIKAHRDRYWSCIDKPTQRNERT